MDVREKLVELLKEMGKREREEGGVTWYDVADHLIAHGVTVQECKGVEIDPFNEWISVKDRLPEKNGRYLTANEKDDGKIYVFDLWFDCQKWYIDEGDDLFIYEVTHWMPLPQQPKGE